MFKNNLIVLIILSLNFLVFPSSAYAYLDPGSGSFIFQVIIATLAGTGFLIKLQWSKVKKLFSRKEDPDDADKK